MTLYDLALYYRNSYPNSADNSNTLLFAKKLAAEEILSGFATHEEALEFAETFHDRDVAGYTIQGFSYNSAAIKQAVSFLKKYHTLTAD